VEFTIRSFGTFTAGLRRLKVGEHVYLDGPWGRFRCIVWAFAVQEIVPDACTYQPSPARAQAFHCP